MKQLMEMIVGIKTEIAIKNRHPLDLKKSTSTVSNSLSIGFKTLKLSTSAANDGFVQKTEGILQPIREAEKVSTVILDVKDTDEKVSTMEEIQQKLETRGVLKLNLEPLL